MEGTVNVAEEAEYSRKMQDAPPIDKDRRCCYPSDRDLRMEGDIRILFCRVCGLIHRKEDYSDLNNPGKVCFIVGERVEITGDAA